MRKLLFIASILLITNGCKKEPLIPVEPEIELISIGPTTMEQFVGQVTLRFSYKDGDGDIGFEDPDTYALRIKDSRLGDYDWYHIPPLAPPGEEIPIQGELEVKLNTLFLLGNGSQESTQLTIRLRDRAGNWSNELVSPTILIKDSL